VLTAFFEHSHADRLPYVGVTDICMFDLQGLDGLDEVGVFPFDVDPIADNEARLGDLDDTHMEMGIIMGNLTNELFCGGHVKPPSVRLWHALAGEDVNNFG
jgi:hypothetical protein